MLISPPSHLPHQPFFRRPRTDAPLRVPPHHPNPYPSQSGDSSTVPPIRWLFQPGRDKGTEPGRGGHPHVLLLGMPGGSSLPGAPRELPLGEGRGAQRLLRAVGKGVWGDPGGPRLRARLCPRAASPEEGGGGGRGSAAPAPSPADVSPALQPAPSQNTPPKRFGGRRGRGLVPAPLPPPTPAPKAPARLPRDGGCQLRPYGDTASSAAPGRWHGRRAASQPRSLPLLAARGCAARPAVGRTATVPW